MQSLCRLEELKTMRRLNCSWITGRSHCLVLSIVFCLTKQLANSLHESILNWSLNTGYPAICDREYIAKYFDDKEHRQAVLAGLLFPPHNVQRHASDASNEDEYTKHLYSFEEDKDSYYIDHGIDPPKFINHENNETPEFLSVENSPNANELSLAALNFGKDSLEFSNDDKYVPLEYITYGNNELSEFMQHENPQSDNFFYEMKKISTPNERNFSDFNELKKKFKSKGRFSPDRRYRKLRIMKHNKLPKRRVIRGEFTREFFERKNRYLKSLRRNDRRNRFNDDNQRFYTMMDTFGPIYNGRRGGKKDFRQAIGKAYRNHDNCKSLRRIVGGYAVQTPEVLPYMVFVDSGCGGAIIGETWVLTAAHCVDDESPLYVHVGSVRLMGGCQYHITYTYVHPHFTRSDLEFDVALLKISPTFVYSPAIRPIKMSTVKAKKKSCGVVAGWGAKEYQGGPSHILSMTTIPIISKKKCRKYNIKTGQFCAGFKDGHSDTCQGDSGGPFVVNDILVGIVSFGYKCAKPRTPGVYVDVSYHRDWIRSVTGF